MLLMDIEIMSFLEEIGMTKTRSKSATLSDIDYYSDNILDISLSESWVTSTDIDIQIPKFWQ